MILYLFLTHLGIGILFTLACISREAGVKFFRFNAGLAAILIAIAMALHPPDDVGSAARVGFVAVSVAEVVLLLYWSTVGRALASIRPAILGTACLAGAAALVAQGLAASSGRTLPAQVLTVASFASSAAFLGGACTAMILGHWYLVIPSLQVSHLQSVVKLHILSMLVRIAVVGAAIYIAIATWQPESGPSFRHYILSVASVFFWERMLFGLALPGVLSVMTWETAKIRSTQSATGILYVDFFAVVVGEVLAKYLLLATRVPV